MDIKPIDNSVSREAAAAPKKTEQESLSKALNTSSDSSNSTDTLTLTDKVAQLIELQDSLAKVPDVNNEKVEAIKQALADGAYEIDASALAENLLKAERE